MKLSNTTIYILIFSLIILLLTILGYFRYLKFENAKKYQNCGYTLVNNIINPELLLKINKKINNLELETYNNCCKKDINRKSVVLYNETDNINILKQPILDDIKKIIDKFKIIGVAAGSLFVFKGKYRAVLISYPNRQERKPLY